MADVIRHFFESLGGPHPAIPKTVSGTLRFDVDGDQATEHWLITFDEGSVSATESEASADCVVGTSRRTLASIIEGQTNALAALLRGTLKIEGRTILLALFRSVLQESATASHEASDRLLVGRHS